MARIVNSPKDVRYTRMLLVHGGETNPGEYLVVRVSTCSQLKDHDSGDFMALEIFIVEEDTDFLDERQ
jgi:hypothetical protein